MPRTKNVPRRCEGDDPAVRDQQRAVAALAAKSAPAPHHEAHPEGAGASGVTLVQQEEEETLSQQRDRLDLAGSSQVPAPGPQPPSVLIEVEDSSSGQNTGGRAEDTGGGEKEGEAGDEEEEVDEGGEAAAEEEEGKGEAEWERTEEEKWGDDEVEHGEEEQEEEDDEEEEEEEEEEEDEDEEQGEGEEEGDREDMEEQEVYRDQNDGGKRKRAENTAAVAKPAPLPLAAPTPSPGPPPFLRHVDVQWVEGQGERCAGSGGQHITDLRCYSTALPGRAHCAFHDAQIRGVIHDPQVSAEGGSGGGKGDRGFTSTYRGVSAQSSSRWKAQLNISSKSTCLGTFDREEDAARACDRIMVVPPARSRADPAGRGRCACDGLERNQSFTQFCLRGLRERGGRAVGHRDAGGDGAETAAAGTGTTWRPQARQACEGQRWRQQRRRRQRR